MDIDIFTPPKMKSHKAFLNEKTISLFQEVRLTNRKYFTANNYIDRRPF